MDCTDTRRVVAAWEEGSALVAGEAREARAHILSCASCRSAYQAFLTLAVRDEDGYAVPETSPAGRALADRVMGDIASRYDSSPTRTVAFPRRRAISLVAAAAAACMLLIIGFLRWDRQTIQVRFVLDAPGAKSVYIAGDFSSWDPAGLELKKNADGLWERTVRLRRGQAYSYNFLVDGTSWVVDPTATERVEDGFGGESALIRL